jgi:hypothetical protein
MTNLATQPTLGKLRQLYSFRGEDEVVAFLEKHPFLNSILTDAAVAGKQFFPAPILSLEVDKDAELNDAKLLLFIAIDTDPETAYNCNKRFDREWWIPNLDRAQGKLSIHLEFV